MKNKKTIILFVMLAYCISFKAQIMQIMKGEKVVATYTASEADKVIFKESPDPSTANHEYVEIGGVKWATMNLGATTVAGSPETCYGDYFAWSETEPRYVDISITSLTEAFIGGWKDGYAGYASSFYPAYKETTLDAKHDAATQYWGKDWRTPTATDFQKLLNACTVSGSKISTLSTSKLSGGIYWLTSTQTYLSEYKGIAGVLFVDLKDTNKRIFFPASGSINGQKFHYGESMGDYWSSEDNWYSDKNSSKIEVSGCPWRITFNSDRVALDCKLNWYGGYSIRPVYDPGWNKDLEDTYSLADAIVEGISNNEQFVIPISQKGFTPTIKVKYGNTLLAENKDYSIAITNSDGVEVYAPFPIGAYTMTISGIASYSGSITIKFFVKNPSTPPTPTTNHEYVEIGGAKWATMNIGATTVAGSPATCFGDYFMWGETEPCYTGITIIDANTIVVDGWKSKYPLGYYNYNDNPSNTGSTLDAQHDAATQNWGEDWRTPTSDDFKALMAACGLNTQSDIHPLSTSNPTGGAYYLFSNQTFLPEYTNVPGVLLVDKQDNSKRLFFPGAGSIHICDFVWQNTGAYWTSNLYMNSKNSSADACCFDFYDYSKEEDFSRLGISSESYEDYERGFTIRPVKK